VIGVDNFTSSFENLSKAKILISTSHNRTSIEDIIFTDNWNSYEVTISWKTLEGFRCYLAYHENFSLYLG
jgi:hypothetical protein